MKEKTKRVSMKLIILDKCTVTNGDIDLSPLEQFGEVEYYDLLSKEEIKRVLVGADAVVCNKAKIDREIIEASTLKFIGVFATGYNNIDVAAATEHGIAVCNVPGYSTNSVAQLTILPKTLNEVSFTLSNSTVYPPLPHFA